MRALIDGTAIRVDLIHNAEDVAKVVQRAIALDLPDLSTNYTGSDYGYQVCVELPQDAFASQGLAAMLAFVAEILGTTPEKLVEAWRAGPGNLAETATN